MNIAKLPHVVSRKTQPIGTQIEKLYSDSIKILEKAYRNNQPGFSKLPFDVPFADEVIISPKLKTKNGIIFWLEKFTPDKRSKAKLGTSKIIIHSSDPKTNLVDDYISIEELKNSLCHKKGEKRFEIMNGKIISCKEPFKMFHFQVGDEINQADSFIMKKIKTFLFEFVRNIEHLGLS